MPFDAAQSEPERAQPDRFGAAERLYSLLFLAITFCLLVMPISMAGLLGMIAILKQP